MTDDLVKQALAELGDVVRCHCDEAFRDRGLHDPQCQCDSMDAVRVVIARIQWLERERVLDAKLLADTQALLDKAGVVMREAADRIEEYARAFTNLQRGYGARGERIAELTDPVAVHANMLRGTIAKPTVEQIIHLYGVDALCKALAPVIVREAGHDPAPDLAELVEAAKGLNTIVEGIQGAMDHGVWRDEKGLRFKDTPQWVTFYNALAKIKEPQT